jgi:hypothetical protein
MPVDDIETKLENIDFDSIKVQAPNDPGPALICKDPLVGSLRRDFGIPVVRDEISKEINNE